MVESKHFALYERLTVGDCFKSMPSVESILSSLGGEARIGLGLDRFSRALAAFGNPEKNVKTIVIGGTNGKGTTALLISHALKEHGLRIGTYLSPHLQDVRERMLLNLEPIAHRDLERLALDLNLLALRFELTYFEFLTLIYFKWAREERLDYSVLEVGLGGRLDATNVTSPVATAITNIGWDHQRYLGHNLSAILNEKLGILRKGAPVFTAIEEVALRKQCQESATRVGSNLHIVAKFPRVLGREWTGQVVEIDGLPYTLKNPSAGTVKNTALAHALLTEIFPQIGSRTLQRAFAACNTPGRFEVVGRDPLVVLSGDHNPDGLSSLFETLDSLATRPIRIVCGFSLDKPYREMYRMLYDRAASITLTRARLNEMPPPDYQAMGEYEHEPGRALARERERAHDQDVVLVTGSLYLVGTIRRFFSPAVRFY